MHKKYHEKFKILDILAVTTQAHEGIETEKGAGTETGDEVTTQETPGGQAPLTKHEQKFE